jgi:hypothetical protein
MKLALSYFKKMYGEPYEFSIPYTGEHFLRFCKDYTLVGIDGTARGYMDQLDDYVPITDERALILLKKEMASYVRRNAEPNT